MEHQEKGRKQVDNTISKNLLTLEHDRNDTDGANKDINTEFNTELYTDRVESDNSLQSENTHYKNAKERLYDKIPISLKALDTIIAILITVLVLMMAYFIMRKLV